MAWTNLQVILLTKTNWQNTTENIRKHNYKKVHSIFKTRNLLSPWAGAAVGSPEFNWKWPTVLLPTSFKHKITAKGRTNIDSDHLCFIPLNSHAQTGMKFQHNTIDKIKDSRPTSWLPCLITVHLDLNLADINGQSIFHLLQLQEYIKARGSSYVPVQAAKGPIQNLRDKLCVCDHHNHKKPEQLQFLWSMRLVS